jgi:signal recognition particle subunit SRP54
MLNDDMSKRMLAIIQSMTKKERRFPDLIKASRKIRIAKGSGTEVPDVNRLLKQFMQMEKMFKKVGKNPAALKNMMRAMPR